MFDYKEPDLSDEKFARIIEEAYDALPLFKSQREYNRTKKNLKECEVFDKISDKFSFLNKQYKDSFRDFLTEVTAKGYRSEFSKGGELIHRGFYSPSFLECFAVNVKRGKLYQKIMKRSKYDYEYIYDENDRLICAKKYSDEFGGVFQVIETEFLVYEGEHVIGLTYEPTHYEELFAVCDCRYRNELLIQYEKALVMADEGRICDINVEVPIYDEAMPIGIYFYTYVPRTKSLYKEKGLFSDEILRKFDGTPYLAVEY